VIRLGYGSDSDLYLELPDSIEVFNCSAPHGVELADPERAVAQALADPFDFPPLSQATVTGDRVVLALDQTVPQAAKMVSGVLRSLFQGDTRPEDVTIVTDGSDGFAGPLLSGFSDDVRFAVKVLLHDPDDARNHAYLAASKEGHPIHVHRALVDADVLVPIGVTRLQRTLAYYGAATSLFPLFSDRATLQRYCRSDTDDHEAHARRCRSESREVAWLLGSLMSVQVIPGAGDSLLAVLAGDLRTMDEHGQRLCARAWRFPLPKRAGIVVASVGGNAAQQTWEGFARALDVALACVTENGAVVLCTSLATRPGPALRRLTSWTGDDVLPKRIRRDFSGDGLSALRLADAREHVHVYLMSSLEDVQVEELGVAPVSTAHEIERLCRHYESCVVLGNAQFAGVSIEG